VNNEFQIADNVPFSKNPFEACLERYKKEQIRGGEKQLLLTDCPTVIVSGEQ